MSKQMEDVQVIRLLDSQIHLCDEIKNFLIKKETRKQGNYILYKNIQNMTS